MNFLVCSTYLSNLNYFSDHKQARTQQVRMLGWTWGRDRNHLRKMDWEGETYSSRSGFSHGWEKQRYEHRKDWKQRQWFKKPNGNEHYELRRILAEEIEICQLRFNKRSKESSTLWVWEKKRGGGFKWEFNSWMKWKSVLTIWLQWTWTCCAGIVNGNTDKIGICIFLKKKKTKAKSQYFFSQL